MPTVSGRCPSCERHVDLGNGQSALLAGPDGNTAAYAFVCPCGEPVVQPADRLAAAMLRAGGASVRGPAEPAGRLPHPEQPADGPPFTSDDLIDFHLLLEEGRGFERS